MTKNDHKLPVLTFDAFVEELQLLFKTKSQPLTSSVINSSAMETLGKFEKISPIPKWCQKAVGRAIANEFFRRWELHLPSESDIESKWRKAMQRFNNKLNGGYGDFQ